MIMASSGLLDFVQEAVARHDGEYYPRLGAMGRLCMRWPLTEPAIARMLFDGAFSVGVCQMIDDLAKLHSCAAEPARGEIELVCELFLLALYNMVLRCEDAPDHVVSRVVCLSIDNFGVLGR